MENRNWKEIKLGDCSNIITGFPFKSNEYEFNGELRVVRGENVTIGNLRWDSEKYWNKETDALVKYFLKEDDIVIGMDGSRVGQNRSLIKSFELPLILAQRVAMIRAKQDVCQLFLWYNIFSNNFKEYVEAIHTGTSIPHISLKQIKDFEIQIPPLPEQKAIASVLSSLDDKIDLLHQQNQTLEALAETLFRQWFVEEAKEDWEEMTLGSLIDIFGGYSYKGNKIGQGSSYLLGMGCVSYSDRFLYSGMRKYDEEVNNKYLVEKGDIVIATRQQSDNLPILGAPAIIPEIDKNYKVIVGTNLYKVVNNSNLNYYSLYRLLKTPEYKNFIKSNAKGSTVRMITKDAILSFPILLPPNNTVNKLNKELSSVNNKIELNNNQIQTLTHLRDTLLPKLMSCEVRVRL